MKRGALALIVVLLVVGWAKGQTITASYYNAPLSKVVEEVASQCKVKLAYDYDLVSKYVVTAKFVKSSPSEALQIALENVPLSFVDINGVFVIKPDISKPQLQAAILTLDPTPPKYKVLGLVREKFTGETLPYASVALVGTHNGVAANSDGYFSIITQQADSLQLSVSYIGYLPMKVSVSPANQRGLVVVEMERQIEIVSEVVVSTPRTDVMQTEVDPSRIRLNSARITEFPSISELDITAPLQLLPGIDGTTESLAGLNIRKSTPDKNLVLYDGFTVYQTDHFFGAFSSFNAKAIKDVQVYKGGYDATYGGRSAGVVEITGKSGNMSKSSVDVGVDLLSVDATVETPIGDKASLIVSGRRSYTDKYQSSLYDDLLGNMRADLSAYKNEPAYASSQAKDPSYYFYDLNAKLTINITNRDVVSFSGYKGHDDLTFFNSGQRFKVDEVTDFGSSGASLRWARQWSSRFSQSIVFGGSRYNLFYEHEDSLQRRRALAIFKYDTIQKHFVLDSKINDASLTFSNALKLNESNSLDFGLSVNKVKTDFLETYMHQVNDSYYIDTTRREAGDSRVFAAFIQNTYSNGAIKMLKTGLRINRYDVTQKTYIEPRIQIAIAVTPSLQFKASGGRYHQFINKIPMVTIGDYRSVWAVSNGNHFPVVISDHYIAGFNLKPYSSMVIDVEAYFKNTDGLSAVYNTYKRTSSTQVSETRRYYKYGSKVSGLDILVRQSFGRYQLWLAYTLSKARNQSTTLNGGDSYPAYDDQLHELKVFGVAKVRRWNFSLAYIYGSGKPWDEPTFTNSFVISPTYSMNSERLPAYQRLDLAVGYTYKIGRISCRAGINVFNVFNISNVLGRPYTIKDDAYSQVAQGNSPLDFFDLKGMGEMNSVFLNFNF